MTVAPSATQPPLRWLLLFLSSTTGLVDAASVLGLGKVFTANMTGNVVFLGFAAARTPGFQVAPSALALVTFMVGALLAGRLGRRFAGRPLRRWLILAATVETVLLAVAALVAIGFDVAAPPAAPLFAIIALTAIAMGFRNATVRQLKVADLTTTVLTLTITGLAADSSLAGGTNPNWPRRIASVVAIFAGAVAGAILLRTLGLSAPLGVAALMIFGGTLLCAAHPAAADPLPN